MIRIAHVIPSMGVGGAEQMVLDLCKYCDRAEFTCAVATPAEGPIAKEIRRAGTPVFVGRQSVSTAARWADLINLHWFQYDPGWLALVKSMGRPFVTTLHSFAVLPPIPAVTICVSEAAYQIQADRSRCLVIPNGVDLSRFAPHPRPEREEIVITRVCRPPKCAPYFWEAMKQVLDRYPQTRLWIVGEAGRARPPMERVRFLGLRRDVPAILAQSDLFVYTPSPEFGSHDLVVMEASAAGVPCVVSDTHAVRSSIVEGQNGFLTPFGDVDAIVERVGRLVRDTDLRARMSAAAVRIAREQFDMRAVTRRYEVVYRAVLKAQGRHAARRSAVSASPPGSVVEIGGIKIPLGLHLSSAVRHRLCAGAYESAEVETVARNLSPDDVVMELGTGLGFLASYCARRIGSDRVHTYEANPELESHIRQTFALNDVSPRLHICILGERTGERAFYVERDFWASSTQRRSRGARAVVVPVKSLNEEIRRIDPSFLIIDIEGGEEELFRLIDFHHVQKIVVELHPHLIGPQRVRLIESVLAAAGFAIQGRYAAGHAEVLFLQRSTTHE